MPKTLHLFFDVESADEDVSLADILDQCGYDCSHEQVADFDLPGISGESGHERLHAKIMLKASATPVSTTLVEDIGRTFRLSHPAVVSCRLSDWRLSD